MLSNLIQTFYDARGLTDADIDIRKGVKKELTLILRSGDPNIKLQFFGSSANGFGMKDSDIDIYLTSSMELSKIKVMLEVRKDLFSDVIHIPSVNIPIVRYRHRVTNLMVDLTQNKGISLKNTSLLKAYSKIDPRVSILGCFLKTMAKSVNICDQVQRSLNSFAYSLMMVHFLQQHSVLPVLSVLQLTQNTSDNFEIDVGNLNKVWPDYGKNKESLQGLWLGFLNYYSKFDFINDVITINQIESLKKHRHSWANVHGIVIQNPFETDQNVAKLVFDEMSDHIIKTIRHWQKYFCNYTSSLSSAQNLFADHRIKYAAAPLNRICYKWGNRGHLSMNCPYTSD